MLEQHLATLLLQGGMYTQGSACGPALSCLVEDGNLGVGGTSMAFSSSSYSYMGVTRGLSVAEAWPRLLPLLRALHPIAFHPQSTLLLAS